MGFNPFKKSSWKKVGNDINKAVVQPVQQAVTPVVNTVVKETTKAVNVAGKTIVDTSGKLTKDAENLAKDTVNNIQKTVVSDAVKAYTETTKAALASAKVAEAAMADVEAGAKLTGQILEKGVYEVAEAGELIAEWIEENYCQIGVSIALGTIFAALLYRPEPSSQATTTAATAPLSSTAILYLSAKETVGAAALGTACDLTAKAFVELIWISKDIQKAIGNKNKQILTDAIAFTLAKSIDKAAGAMIVPQSCAAVVAGIVTTLVAQLACEQTLPSGAREWATVGASGL
jgi:hypothetical protein